MNSFAQLDSVHVGDAMHPVRFTVSPIEKLDAVAKLFEKHDTNSAPVVDELGRCVGIITTRDLVRSQSLMSDMDARIDHGVSFDVSLRREDGSIELIPHPFDEVQRQMTSQIQTIDENDSLELAATIMCQLHIHHLLVLDGSQRPIGILSALDILAKLTEN